MVGFGNVASWAYFPRIRQRPELVLRYVYDYDVKLAQEVANTFGGKVGKSLDEVIYDREVDAVFICTPPAFHHQAIKKAIDAGKHILCEKPLCDTIESSEDIWNAVRNTDLVHMVHFTLRFKPAVRFLLEIINSGMIGRVCHVTGFYIQSGWFYEDGTPSKTRTDAKDWQYQQGGGVLNDLSPHVIDLSRICFGEIVKVNGNCSSLRTDDKAATDDVCVFDLETETGALVQWTVSRWGFADKDNLSLEIHGTKGKIIFTPTDIRVCTKDNLKERSLLVPTDQQGDFIDTFYNSVMNQEGITNLPTFEDGYVASKIAHYIRANVTVTLVENEVT